MRLPARWSWLLLAAFLFAPSALGTAQVPDFLLIDGERINLHSNPLAGWLTQHPGALPPAKFDSSGNWRGYIATWELDEGKLWLRKVEISVGQREGEWDGVDETWPFIYQDVTDQMFPGKREVVADWFSGVMIVPKGKLVQRVHMGYQSSYERYTLLWIRKGELSRRMDFDAKRYAAFRKERFAAYKRTEDYRKRMAVVDEADESAAEHEQHLFAAPEVYLSEDPGPAGR